MMRKRIIAVALFFVLVATLLLGVSAGRTEPGALVGDHRPGDPTGLTVALLAQERHTDELLTHPGVVGTAVGVGADGEAVIRIYTESAAVAGLPRELDGVRAEMRVTGRIVALHHRPGHDGGPGGGGGEIDPTARFPRPVPIGVSTGHPTITAGTIGARVSDGADVYALSNNHVFAASNAASTGDHALQPGPADGGTDPADAIGTLDDFEPLSFDPVACDVSLAAADPDCNTMDAAIVLSSVADLGNSTPADGYGTPDTATVAASLGQAVEKYGRTTGLTSGQVEEINVTLDVCYEVVLVFCTKTARFVEQIAIGPGAFSAGGDSGPLIVQLADEKPVGLLFAGSDTRTFASPIDPVLSRFGVTIDGAAAAPPPPPPPPGAFTLTATGYKVKGLQKVDLDWAGASGSDVDVYRDGALVAMTANDGAYTDNIDLRGGGGYSYQVCEQGTTTCSGEAIVSF